MDFGFGTMNRKIVVYVFLACGLSILLAGCDYTKYPSLSPSKWVSMDPNFTLEYQGEYPYETIEYLSFNEELLPVHILYFPNDFEVIPASAVDEKTNTIYMPTVYLRGRWKMSTNELIFYIEEDNLFGGIYEEIHFTREDFE